MDTETKVTGIVLNSSPIGETDRRISLLTLERGRISAFLKGAKKSKGSLLSSVEPFSFGEFYVYGTKSYSIYRAQIKNHFKEIKADIDSITYGSYFLEVAEYYSRENADERDRLALLYVALSALTRHEFENEFVKLVYELKTIAINGEYPNVFECVRCGSKENLGFFSVANRGCVCGNCRGAEEGLLSLDKSSLYTLDFVFRTMPKKLFSFRLSAEVFTQLEELMRLYKNRYFQHKFKTEEFIGI